MIWKVKTKTGTIELSPLELSNELAGSFVNKEPKQEHIDLIRSMTSQFQTLEQLAEMNLNQIAYIAFMYGYFYKIFLTKNDVEIVQEIDDEPSSKSGDQSSSNSND